MNLTRVLRVVFCILACVAVGACSSSSSTEEDLLAEEELLDGEMEGLDELSETDAIPLEGSDEMGDLTELNDTLPEEDMSSTDTGFEDQNTPWDSQASMGSGEAGTYTVQPGDALMKIAFEYYGDVYQWRRIYEMNQDKIVDPNVVPAGVVLTVEQPAQQTAISRNGERYLIQEGDTLGTISSQVYGTPAKWRSIAENNPELIRDPDKIYAGFYLYYAYEEGMRSVSSAQDTMQMEQEQAFEEQPVQEASPGFEQ